MSVKPMQLSPHCSLSPAMATEFCDTKFSPQLADCNITCATDAASMEAAKAAFRATRHAGFRNVPCCERSTWTTELRGIAARC